MALLIGLALYLLITSDMSQEARKKISKYMMSAAHVQLLTGFILFFLMLSEINHMKIGIKMLLAIELAVIATLYKKKISHDQQPHSLYLPLILVSGIIITLIAYLL
jgi:hypothetical protein